MKRGPQEHNQPDVRPLTTGSVAPTAPLMPQGVALKDEATRYMLQRERDRFQKRLSRPFPDDISAAKPPFRPSRLRRYTTLLSKKAGALMDRGDIDILTNGEALRAELRVFSDGTAVLEYEYHAAYGETGGATHIARGALTQDFIARRLELALLNCRVRPIADQEI